jgi:hypothetical protein
MRSLKVALKVFITTCLFFLIIECLAGQETSKGPFKFNCRTEFCICGPTTCLDYAGATIHACDSIELLAFCCNEPELPAGYWLIYKWEIYVAGRWNSYSTTTNNATFRGTDDPLFQVFNNIKVRCTITTMRLIGMVPNPVDTTYTGEARIIFDLAEPYVTNCSSGVKYKCHGDNVSFFVEVVGLNVNYIWRRSTDEGASWHVISGETSNTLNLTANTGYDGYQYQCEVSNGCGSDMGLITQLFVNTNPSVSLGADRHICTGESTTIDAGPGYEAYLWNTGERTPSIKVTEQGNFSVVVTDENGCTDEDNIKIILDPKLPEIDLGDDAAYCPKNKPVLDAGSNFDHYSWNTGSSQRFLTVTETGTYHVTVSMDNNVCIESDTVDIIIAEPYDKEGLCIVTADMTSGKNLLVWEKTPDVGILSYRLWRESSIIGEYNPISTVPVDDLSIFMDTEVSPENQTYLYKLTVIDTCGNESDLQDAPYHKPIFLKYVPSELGVSLEWTDYEIQGIPDLGNYLKSYQIYRGEDSTGLTFYKAVGDINDYQDTDPATKTTKFYYRVAGVLDSPCYPSAAKKSDIEPVPHSFSNLEQARIVIGNQEIRNIQELLIYPNPFNLSTTIRFPNPETKPYRLVLTDLSGKVFSVMNNITTSEYVLRRDDLKPGLYFIELGGPKIYRGKLIIK